MARKAYEALLRVSLLQPTSPRFQDFAESVIERASSDYNYTFSDGEEVSPLLFLANSLKLALELESDSILVNPIKSSAIFYNTASFDRRFGVNLQVNFFIGAFYDGVYLLGMALNETLAEGGDIRDGMAITRRMWDRDFIGITGHVRIDDNGDRDADYSILDLDPITGK